MPGYREDEVSTSVAEELGIEELRARFLSYTRKAFRLLPDLGEPRILDVGCSSGLLTVELARLSGGEVVGIDVDEAALGVLERRVHQEGLQHRVRWKRVSLLDAFPQETGFSIVWEEGVLHLLDPGLGAEACHRLLRPGGFLVMNETLEWLGSALNRVLSCGFEPFQRFDLPPGCWWTHYYEPLIDRVRSARERTRSPGDLAAFARYEAEIAMVEREPRRFDCGFCLLRKVSGFQSPGVVKPSGRRKTSGIGDTTDSEGKRI